MKKKYSLDYTIERDTDRLDAIRQILDELDTTPTNSELEQMASYVLYGKDENGLNAIKRGECTDSNRRYSTFKRTADKLQSLDEYLENPLKDQQDLKPFDAKNVYMKKTREIRHPKYDKEGNLVDIGDADVPGLPELWDRIDYIEHVVAANEGRIPLDPETMTFIDNPYRLYQLRHQLIDMRRHQYYIRDSYKPYIYFLNVKPPTPQPINFDSDAAYWLSFAQWRRRLARKDNPFFSTNLRDYETKYVNGRFYIRWVVRHQKFDWENKDHVSALMKCYSSIYMQNWDKLFSWGRTLIFDLDKYVSRLNLTPVREHILLRRIDKEKSNVIAEELKEKFGISYNGDYINSIFSKEITKQITAIAKRHRLLVETPLSERKVCNKCHRVLPRDNVFFAINKDRRDGFSSRCKEFEREIRIARGDQARYDLRHKDAAMLEMQARKTH